MKNEDFIPLSKRLKRIQSDAFKDFTPLEVQPPSLSAEQSATVKKLGNAHNRRARLKLPELPTSAVEVDKINSNTNNSSMAIGKCCSFKESAPANDGLQLVWQNHLN
jgi:hypothetical protein